jgi:hypothetical protein
MSRFQQATGDWVRYRALPNRVEVDFHYGSGRDSETPYRERMAAVWSEALEALKAAQATGRDWAIFTHGSSTSRLGATTARSQVRSLMRSPDATPYIVRSECIQHESVFVARIKQPTG